MFLTFVAATPGLIALAAAAPLMALSKSDIWNSPETGRLTLLNVCLLAGTIGVFTVPLAWLLAATTRHDRRVVRVLWMIAVLALLGEAACAQLVLSGRAGDFPLL